MNQSFFADEGRPPHTSSTAAVATSPASTGGVPTPFELLSTTSATDSLPRLTADRLQCPEMVVSSVAAPRSTTGRAALPSSTDESENENGDDDVDIEYIDASVRPDPRIPPGGQRRVRGGVIEPFPQKLHRLLLEVEADRKADVVGFFPHGRAFCVFEPVSFTSCIMPKYFGKSKLQSFQRQLNLYGFTRISDGPDSGGYYHKLFLKGRPALCRGIHRYATKSVDCLKKIDKTGGEASTFSQGLKEKNKSRATRKCPNFYAMAPIKTSEETTAAAREAREERQKCQAIATVSAAPNASHKDSTVALAADVTAAGSSRQRGNVALLETIPTFDFGRALVNCLLAGKAVQMVRGQPQELQNAATATMASMLETAGHPTTLDVARILLATAAKESRQQEEATMALILQQTNTPCPSPPSLNIPMHLLPPPSYVEGARVMSAQQQQQLQQQILLRLVARLKQQFIGRSLSGISNSFAFY